MNMIYNASAGTGKTWQVTDLYSALVLGRSHDELPAGRKPVDPRRILLMTFTENAAAELRQRVAERMFAAQRDADADLADCARRVLRTLPAANISTIHAFCAGLLREYALEIGLSPSFQTLEDEERNVLLDDVLKTELFHTLEVDPNLRDFCAGISVLHGDYSLLSTVRSLLEKAASLGLDLSDAEAMLPPQKQSVVRADFERIRDDLSEFGLSQKTVLDALDALNDFLRAFPEGVGGLKKFGRVKAVKYLSDELFDLKDRFVTEYHYEQNIETFRAFARYAAAAARKFSEAKRARDVVDFGDQLLLTRDLLTGGDFSHLFDWIIVDEVQDTSRVQYDLIHAIWGAETNLVICGDRKQSIYAWRSADPHVMPDLEAAMATRGVCKKIDLKTSYRSKARVLEAVNKLFAGLYASYDALEPLDVQDEEKPCVEFLMRASDEEGAEEEMVAVARRIRLLVDGSDEWRPTFGYNGKRFVEGEPFGYGDILILLKRSTHQAVLEKALRTAGIPYTSGGKGRGLFEKQEVRDLLLFLQVMTQPQNDLALVGFLRSPFANLPDEKIIELGWDGEAFDREILRKQFFDGGSDVAERILRFRAMVGKKRPSQLVRELVRETGFDAHWAGQPAGEQHLANFKKAVDWLRKAERGGQVLIGDVVRRFEKAIQSPPSSGAAEALLPDPEQNAVTLMTVHGAKGLTKRVCFVPDISFRNQADKGFVVLADGRLEVTLTDLMGRKLESPGWKMAKAADKTVRDMESINVFYVAMTRARDLVVFSGAGTKKPDGWLKQAAVFLEGASSDILCRRAFDEIPEIEKPNIKSPMPEGVQFQPLEIPKGMERRSVTSLCKKDSQTINRQSSIVNSPMYGTLGHTVLEELANNGWDGDIPLLVDREGGASSSAAAKAMAGQAERTALVEQLEAARRVLREETRGAEALFAEHSFVLKRGEVVLDGTIDLLVKRPPSSSLRTGNHWNVLDYKFSNEPPEVALKMYSLQLMAYREAIEKLNPGAEVSASLVLIGESVRIISV